MKNQHSDKMNMTTLKPTLKAQVIGYAMAAFSFIAVYGMFADFLPDRTYLHYATYFSIAFSSVATVFAYWAYFKKDSAWRAKLAELKQKQRPWLIVPGLPLILFMLPYFAFTSGIPSLINYAIGAEGAQIYRVESRNSTYTRRQCTGGVNIEHEVIMKNQICGIPEDLWKQIEKGDSLELIGNKSLVGLSYDSLRLIKASGSAPPL